jgi:thioredoxin-dependent peroxiredoxin
MSLTVGNSIPNFSLNDHNGKLVKLESLKGTPFIIYFYPKDDTPGCTQEACDFRDNFQQLNQLKYKVIGISPDSIESHKLFREKYKLEFTLLSDPEKKLAELFDVYKEKNMYGKMVKSIIRSTFIFNNVGIMTHEFRNIKATGHVVRLLNFIS